MPHPQIMDSKNQSKGHNSELTLPKTSKICLAHDGKCGKFHQIYVTAVEVIYVTIFYSDTKDFHFSYPLHDD